MALVNPPETVELKALHELIDQLSALLEASSDRSQLFFEHAQFEYIDDAVFEKAIENELRGLIMDIQKLIDIFKGFQ